ncbi:MAG: tyrosine protein phosphatase yvh1 [Peltula sp. TS41687]|nr:MAG: tyrosine protein phosphatase yvh1 [Peltula sp. TS41687]
MSRFICMRRKTALREANITHVLSVIPGSTDEDVFASYTHMTLDVYDLEDENLLQHFPAANTFINEGLSGNGGVFVHCAMGKSRSAACVMAYLMQKYHISPQEALSRIRQARPKCEPNEGFMKQLELYYELDCTQNIDDDPRYQRWLYQREVQRSIASGRAPDNVRFEDEQSPSGGVSETAFELRCRKCRRTLATEQFLVPHPGDDVGNQGGSSDPCAHYFLEPLSWMRSELGEGKLSGRLECPKCKANVGKYAWQGIPCSCGRWTVPGISLARSKVDEVKIRPGQVTASPAAIRLPPTTLVAPPALRPHAGG